MRKKIEKDIYETEYPVVELNTASVTVSVIGPWGDQERDFIYPNTISTDAVSTSLSNELETKFKPKTKKQIIEVINIVKSWTKEIEIRLSLEEGLSLKIKREPKKIIKIFQETDK